MDQAEVNNNTMVQAANTDTAGRKYQRSGRDRRVADRRAAAVPVADGDLDTLTGLYNLDAWNRVLEVEDERCKRYGHTSCIVAVELGGLKMASAHLICRAGLAIRFVMKERDFVARVGPEKFAALVAESNAGASGRVVQRIRTALGKAGVVASVGVAMRLPEKGLQYAYREACRAKQYRVP